MLGRSSWQTLRNRRGVATAQASSPVIWIHAASLGELKSVRVFLAYLKHHFPAHQLLVTVNNPLAMQLAAGWHDLPLVLQLAPLDSPATNARFLDHWQPVAFFNVESEIWPLRFRAIARRGIPMALINARLSDKSLSQWKWLGLHPSVFDGVERFFCQDQATARNFAALGIGAARIEVTENLKALVTAQDPTGKPDPLTDIFDRAQTILAASTHKGEDAIILEGFAQLLQRQPNARLILAPRHPKRGDEITRLLAERGLVPVRRSLGQVPDAKTQVYLADTLGEMPLMYGLAGITFVAGSLVPKRGHTPYEPALYGSAIITGPHTQNFSQPYAALQAAGGCRIAADAAELTEAFVALLEAGERQRQSDAARTALAVSLDVDALFDRMVKTAGLTGGKK